MRERFQEVMLGIVRAFLVAIGCVVIADVCALVLWFTYHQLWSAILGAR